MELKRIVLGSKREFLNSFPAEACYINLGNTRGVRYIHLSTKLGSLFCEKKGIKVKKEQHLKSENEKKNIQIGVFLGEKRNAIYHKLRKLIKLFLFYCMKFHHAFL
ncbi:hypothetical protein BpHYR1_007558 [Brachionus plicatilis]|uniref:Uncharacterized protein n=1 Tax=Brachionus plicatilis TaxID=10195 RepID=A0A3M7S1I8_BRAPC|nr:hypothetical protein BpHYR1_007558 [Brachionus plicatilis]